MTRISSARSRPQRSVFQLHRFHALNVSLKLSLQHKVLKHLFIFTAQPGLCTSFLWPENSTGHHLKLLQIKHLPSPAVAVLSCSSMNRSQSFGLTKKNPRLSLLPDHLCSLKSSLGAIALGKHVCSAEKLVIPPCKKCTGR